MSIPPQHTDRVDAPRAEAIFGDAAIDERMPLAAVVDLAALDGLAADATPEQVEAALVRVRASVGDDLDALTRATVRAHIRERYPRVPARMVDAALAPRPAPSPPDDAPRKSQATRIVELADRAGAEWWHDADGDPHVTIPADDHREHHRVGARRVRDWLARQYYRATGGAPSTSALTDALAVLAGRARYDGPAHVTAVRVGGDRDVVYLDLGDATWRAVEITADGWRIVTDPPIRFIRARGARPLPTPTRGGTVDALRDVLGLDAESHRLIVGWLLGALRPTGPYPVLVLAGEQGSGKSTAARLIRRLVDPHVADLRAEPRMVDDLMIAAARSRIVALDNVSHIEPWLSDALCRLATGGAISRRQLYTDDEEVIIEAMRPVIITAIADVMTRGDLLDRAVSVTLPVLAEGDRRTEADILAAYDAAAPGILGALLDGVARAIRDQAHAVVDRMPRMADWATWCAAAAPDLWIVDAYHAMRATAIETALDGDPLAVAIRRLSMPWAGTAADLLALLDPPGRRPRGWPESPRGMSAALRRLAPHLRRVGIDVEMYREAGSGRRLVRLDRRAPDDDPSGDTPGRPSQPSRSSQSPKTGGGFVTVDRHEPSHQPSRDQARHCDGHDGRDGCDGSPANSLHTEGGCDEVI